MKFTGVTPWRALACAALAFALAGGLRAQPESFKADVKPDAAAAGGKVTLVLNRPVAKVTVSFGGQTAKILSIADNIVYLVVPKSLEPGETPPIVIEALDVPSLEPIRTTYLGFKVMTPEPGTKPNRPKPTSPQTTTTSTQPPTNVAPTGPTGPTDLLIATASRSPLSIQRIEPAAAEPGGVITLTLSRPLANPNAARAFFPTRTVVLAPTASATKVTAVVPKDLKEGEVFLVIQESPTSAATPPYAFKVLEGTILGVRKSWVSFVVVVFLALAIGGTAYWRERRAARQKRDKDLELIRSFNAAAPSGERIPTAIPEAPDGLSRACASARCILFAGPGLGAQAGLLTRYQAIVRLVNDLVPDQALRNQLNDALRRGEIASVTDVLGRRIPREVIINALRTLYADVNLSEAHISLRQLPFASVLTTAWDGLIEKMFRRRDPEVVTGETDFDKLKTDGFFIARLNGDLVEDESFIFSSKEYRQILYTRPSYATFISSRITGRPLLFVGMSLTGIEEFFDAFPARVSIDTSYAIIPYTPLWEEQRQRVREEYGVELIGYPPDEAHSELATFLRKLEQAVSRLETSTDVPIADGKLHSVQLTNIGPFPSVKIDNLQDGWNVLLGNNGSGKSTILRAIALALCGDEPEAAIAAAPLLREGEDSGRIEVRIGNVTYRTDLYRDGPRVKLDADLSPLRSGNWAALGFPPLRGVSVRDPSGASPLAPPPPGVRDLLPLIRGTIDTRLDSLKQWLVNLEFFSTPGGNIGKEEARRFARTNDSFYMLLRQFMPGQPVEKGFVDRFTFKVYVKTQDAVPVPIDRLSQGMSSIFGWVGTLIQRIFEIYPNAEPPKSEKESVRQSALVLVDEIDAHLHPEWQRKLRSIITKYLPNVQVIASTHSPLLVAGMRQEELIIARRRLTQPSLIDVFGSPIDPQGLRADQVLTSPLFDLDSARSPEVDEKIDKYVELLGIRQRSEQQERDFLELKKVLTTILVSGETDLERVAERKATADRAQRAADLATAVAGASDEMKEKLRQEL